MITYMKESVFGRFDFPLVRDGCGGGDRTLRRTFFRDAMVAVCLETGGKRKNKPPVIWRLLRYE